jgi:SAM-dependent methyltransferase
VDHTLYDKRRYPIVDVREGYGEWLRARSSTAIDGVDITPQMLEVARGKASTAPCVSPTSPAPGCPPGRTISACRRGRTSTCPIRPLYGEAARVTRRGGDFVLVGFHPQFLMAGVPTHLDRGPGRPVTIRSYVHLLSDHAKAAHAAGWSLLALDEGLVDDAWLQQKPRWEAYAGLPISFAMLWRKR